MAVFHRRGFVLQLAIVLSLCFHSTKAFVPVKPGIAPTTHIVKNRSPALMIHPEPTSSTALQMSSNGDGKGALTAAGLLFIIVLFVGGSILPMMGGGGIAPLANSIASRDEAQQQVVTNDKYRLSRAAIQEKLNTVPVFFVVGDKGEMETRIFMSYNDAMDAAGGNKVVKATTLDQVEYPLVLKRGRMRMAYPPAEVQKAEEALSTESAKTYTLVPSKSAAKDAADFNLELAENDLPIFVADRLAFGDPNGGLKVPLFLEKSDCVTSYTRLRGSNLNLPEAPTVRATTLNAELFSMEKGTRPGVTQLAFYGTAEDLLKASDLIGY